MKPLIIFPCAGSGQRFKEAGYDKPKPLIETRGKTLIQWAVDSLQIPGDLLFIIRRDHDEEYKLGAHLKDMYECTILYQDGKLDGAVCTTLLAEHLIGERPLIISNCDQYYEWDSNKFMNDVWNCNQDGAILVFESDHPKWSYAKIDNDGAVSEVAEKVVISPWATVGTYFYRRGLDFVECAHEMISANDRVNNEFYVCPVYNYIIKRQKRITLFSVDKMVGLGTPEDLVKWN